ncbi:MAG TPA: hypothetical protein VN772_03780, partial [Solirubrobacteraceae bacterium]|nr:hypothetical protein [Solirubrobacteraceae bacterium]
TPAPAGPPAPTGSSSPPAGAPEPPRNGTLTVIAGVGVLLLAMGVGVLIGRSSAPKQSAGPAQVISVAGVGSGTGTSASEGTFTGDWPSGTKGFTVQLQTLPQAGTSASAVEAAKSAATAKGAQSVGALKSEEFSSLTSGSYVIYSGVYHKRSEAQKALAGLKKSFPAATVVEVSNGSSKSSSSTESAGGSSGGAGSNINHPAPPSVLEGLKGAKGKSYVEKSKNLPDVVSTG